MRSLDLSHWYCLRNGELQQLSGLSALKVLKLEGYGDEGRGNISDKGLRFLSGLSALQSLSLSGRYNNISTAYEGFDYNSYGYSNTFTDAGLVHVSQLSALESLDLSYWHRLTGSGLHHLSGLSELKCLKLKGCHNLTDAVVCMI